MLEDERDRHRTQRFHFPTQDAADVVDGQVLFAQGDDLFAEAVGLGGGFEAFGGGKEELSVGVLTELMDQDAKAARRVTPTTGGFGGGERRRRGELRIGGGWSSEVGGRGESGPLMVLLNH